MPESFQPGRWRTCWREVLYVVTGIICIHAKAKQLVLPKVCNSLAATAAQPRGVHQDASEGAVCSIALTGSLEVAPWAQRVLCGSIWHSNLGPAAPAQHWLWQAAERVLAVLMCPLVLAWVTGDPHYLYHLAAAAVLGSAVIWPTLHHRPVTPVTRGAAHTALRLLLTVTANMSVRNPAGLMASHLSAVLASQGRWALFASLVWLQGVLLQAPARLQLALSILDWWSVSRLLPLLEEGLGLVAPSGGLQLLEAVVTVAAPCAPLLLRLLLQRLGRQPLPSIRRRHQQQDHQQQAECQQLELASAGPGGAGSGERRGMKQQASVGDSSAAPSTTTAAGDEQRQAVQGSRSASPPAADSPHPRPTHAKTLDPSRSGANSRGASSSTARGTRNRADDVANSSGGSQGGGSQLRTSPGAGGATAATALYAAAFAGGGAVERLLEDWRAAATAAAASAAPQQQVGDMGTPALLLEQMCYESCCRLVPISLKVPQPPGLSYTAAAGAVRGAVSAALERWGPGGGLVHHLATIPGCVLLLGELVQAARHPAAGGPAQAAVAGGGQQQLEAGAELDVGSLLSYLPAWFQQGWLIPMSVPQAPGSAAPAGSPHAPGQPAPGTLLFQGLPEAPLTELQQSWTEALRKLPQPHQGGGSSSGDSGRGGSSSSIGGSSSGSSEGGSSRPAEGAQEEGGVGPPQAPGPEACALAAPQGCPAPVTSCVVGTWGQPLVLQLVALGGGAAQCNTDAWVRVVMVHQQQVLLDEVVQLGDTNADSPTSRSALSALTVTCTHAVDGPPTNTAAAAAAVVSEPAVVSVYLVPAPARLDTGTDAAGADPYMINNGPTAHQPGLCLPAAHITLLLLPPKPAAELAGWVAAYQLPAAHVASWGSDLAVLVGCGERLAAARTSPHPLEASPAAAGAGSCSSSSKQDLLALCRLSVLAAGQLEELFSGCGLVCAADLVAVAKQRVMVGPTSLQPMAAGSVVPAAGGGSFAGGMAEGLAAERYVAQLPAIRVCVRGGRGHGPSATAAAGEQAAVAAALPTCAAPTPSGAPAVVQALQSPSPTAPASPAPATACPPAAPPGNRGAARPPVDDVPVRLATQPKLQPKRASPGDPSRVSPGRAADANVVVQWPGLKASQHPSAVHLQVARWEAAALSRIGLGAVWVCWHGFRDAGAEHSYRSFRASWLWRWEVVARAYNLAVALALAAKMADPGHSQLWGWSDLPVAIMITELVAHLVLLLVTPRWWGVVRDQLLGSFYLRAGAIWVWEVLAWPPDVFVEMFGSGAQVLLVPVSFLLTPLAPQAGVAWCACMSALGYTTLLLCHTRHPVSRSGTHALLASTIHAARGWVVAGAIAYSLVNMAAMLLACCAWEVVVRRAWLQQGRGQQLQREQEQEEQYALFAPSTSSAVLARRASRPRPC